MLQVDAPRIAVTPPSLPAQPSQWEMNQSTQVLLQRFRLFCDWAARAFLSLKSKTQAWGLPFQPRSQSANGVLSSHSSVSASTNYQPCAYLSWSKWQQCCRIWSDLICSHRHIEATVQTWELHLSLQLGVFGLQRRITANSLLLISHRHNFI